MRFTFILMRTDNISALLSIFTSSFRVNGLFGQQRRRKRAEERSQRKSPLICSTTKLYPCDCRLANKRYSCVINGKDSVPCGQHSIDFLVGKNTIPKYSKTNEMPVQRCEELWWRAEGSGMVNATECGDVNRFAWDRESGQIYRSGFYVNGTNVIKVHLCVK